jgi:hypothetical protein
MAPLSLKTSKKYRSRKTLKTRNVQDQRSVGRPIKLIYHIEYDPLTDWLTKHSEEVSKFAGQCIGIDKRDFKIVASGRTPTEVMDVAQKIDPKIEIALCEVPSDIDGLSM